MFGFGLIVKSYTTACADTEGTHQWDWICFLWLWNSGHTIAVTGNPVLDYNNPYQTKFTAFFSSIQTETWILECK